MRWTSVFAFFASPTCKALGLYLLAIGAFGVVLCIVDKRRAVKGLWRVPEKTLLLCGLLGGALPMYITMRLIRHKTRHPKFMVGLPMEIILHIALFVILFIKNLPY